MLTILLISAVLVTVCVVFHGVVLQTIAKFFLPKLRCFSFYRISLVIFFAILAHIIEIIFFVAPYAIMIPSDSYGTINGVEDPDFNDLFYFSAVTYTSTGYGDLTPVGNLRIFATVEALTGLIMIAWTASFAFLMMQRYWINQQEQNS